MSDEQLTVRILHLADIHLDRPFVRADHRDGDRDRARLRETFVRALGLANEHSVDAVTLGGDLWEDEHVSPDTRRFVASELGKLDRPVLIVAGNHDPLIPGGQYERTEWPENVRLFQDETPTELQLGDNLSIWGVSWRGGSLSPSFLKPGFVGGEGRVHLLLLHGTATHLAHLAGEGDEGYCPFKPEQISEAGFAYCLSGHIHAARAEELFVYPGSPEPLGWGEMDRHCAALVTVEAAEGGVEVELIDVNQHRYEERVVYCSGANHGGVVKEQIDQAVEDATQSGNSAERLHLRLALQGEVDPECQVDAQALAERGKGLAELQVVDRTEPAYDLDSLAEQGTARGTFVKELLEKGEAAEASGGREPYDEAILAGLRALDGRKDLLSLEIRIQTDTDTQVEPGDDVD